MNSIGSETEGKIEECAAFPPPPVVTMDDE